MSTSGSITRVASAIVAFVLPVLSLSALSVDEARHLLVRTGFGATPAEVESLLPLDRVAAVDALLAGVRTTPVLPPPAWAGDYPRPPDPQMIAAAVAVASDNTTLAGPDAEAPAFQSDPPAPAEVQAEVATTVQAARDGYQRELGRRSADLLHWWYGEMIATDSPLTERMVLFWHGHFTSSIQKVSVANLMLEQNLLLRRYALGSFRDLVHAIARDPAMLVYLDGQGSVKAHPNENFARELMELFTLGEGHYTEQDVREVARAFTGWYLDGTTGEPIYDPRRHDDGPKTILGRTGNWDGDAAIDIILDRPEVGQLIVSELWREFISPDPDPRAVAALAQQFRVQGYEIRLLLRSLLTSDAFWSPGVRGTLVKSPVVLAVGTARLLGLDESSAARVADAVRPMGEELFQPPTVKGWPWGDAWITTTTLLAREGALRRLPAPLLQTASSRLDSGTRDIGAMQSLPEEERFDSLLLPIIPSHAAADAAAAPGAADAAVLRRVLLNPLYQLM